MQIVMDWEQKENLECFNYLGSLTKNGERQIYLQNCHGERCIQQEQYFATSKLDLFKEGTKDLLIFGA
jgi:hypothetical protein